MTTIDLESIHLDRGSHGSADEGHCILEVVSMLAGETFGDHPDCASPVVSAFLRSWNDSLDDEDTLQESAHQLVDRMLAVTEEAA